MAMSAGEMVNAGIGIAIAFVVISAVFPVGLDGWYGIDLNEQGFGTYNETTGVWEADSKCNDPGADTKTQTFTKLMPFFGMLVVGLMFVGIAKDAI